MGESIVKLRERRSFPSITTVGNQAISTPIAKGESPGLPVAPYRPEEEIEFLATPTSIRIDDSTSARPGSHDPEKRLFERHSHPSHNVPYNNSRVTHTDPEDDGDDDGPKQHSIELDSSVSDSTFFPYPLMNGETLMEWGLKHLSPHQDEAKFLAFLSLYGPNGVTLRDLITFARLRASAIPSKNHWLLSGEVGPILRPVGDASLPTHCSFLSVFVREVSNVQGALGLQKRLESLGLIQVNYPMGHSSRDWRNDERVWCLAENQMSSHLRIPTWHDPEGEVIIMDLLNVFLEMPSRDVSLLAERHRETFYNHARLFAFEALKFSQTVLKNARDYTVMLILQILTHRSRSGDKELLEFAKAWPSSVNGSEWAIMTLWAELKADVSNSELTLHKELINRITRLLSQKGKRQRRANGLFGYLLVELMRVVETSRYTELNTQIGRSAMEWVETAWFSGSSIERAALCCVLANFQILDRSVLVPTKYHLLYGYYLSRAGHLKHAEEFLASGLSNNLPLQLFSRSWDYGFELVSVLIRLGHWQEAQRWVTNIQELMTSPNRREDSELQEVLPPFIEMRILLEFYQTELLIAAGEVGFVPLRLRNTISKVCSMDRDGNGEETEDSYFQSIRLALKTRLLEIQTWEGSPERALQVAQALITEFSNKSFLGPDIVQWTIQQLLVLSNRLIWAGHVSAASSLLKRTIKICDYRAYSSWLEDLLYAESRIATLNKLLVTIHTVNDPITVSSESKGATNEQPEAFVKPSSDIVSTNTKAMLNSANRSVRALDNAVPAPISTESRNDPRSTASMLSSGTKIETRSSSTTASLSQQTKSSRQKAPEQSVSSGTTEATISRVRALVDFQPSKAGELQFRKGDIIAVIESVYGDWWKGSLRGQTGTFPRDNVEVLADPTQDNKQRESQLEASKPVGFETKEEAPLSKPTLQNEPSRRGLFGKGLVLQQGVRKSMATIIRRAPRVPSTEPRKSIAQSREKETDPFSFEGPMPAELNT